MFPRIAARTSDPSFVAKAVQDWTAAVGGAKTAYIALDVSFQEAPRKAEVVEASAIRGAELTAMGMRCSLPKVERPWCARLSTGLDLAAAHQYRTTPKTVGKWVARFRSGRSEWAARPLVKLIAKPN